MTRTMLIDDLHDEIYTDTSCDICGSDFLVYNIDGTHICRECLEHDIRCADDEDYCDKPNPVCTHCGTSTYWFFSIADRPVCEHCLRRYRS